MKVSSAETVNLSGAEVEELDLDEFKKKRLASIAASPVASPIKERKAEVLASEKKKKKEEYITAKNFAQIKGEIDEENSIPLDNKVKLKSGELAFAAEGQEIKADETPAKGYVKETIVNGKFKYEVVPGANDSPTKIYKIKVPRLEDGKHSTTDFDTMYFNAKGEVISLDQGKGGESQLDPTWLAEKQEEYNRAMEEKEVLASAAIVSEQVESMRSALVDDDSAYSDTKTDDIPVTLEKREAVEAAAIRFMALEELNISRDEAFKELESLVENEQAEFTIESAKQLKVVLGDPQKISAEEMKIIKDAINKANSGEEKEFLDRAHLITKAAECQHLEVVEALIKAGANVNVIDKGKTALDYTNINIETEEKLDDSKGFFRRLWDAAQAATLPLDDHKTSNELIYDVLVAKGAKTSAEIKPAISSTTEVIPESVVEQARQVVGENIHPSNNSHIALQNPKTLVINQR